MGWGASFLVYFKVIHFTCLIFVSNNCLQDHRIIKSVMYRLISILYILATSGITCLVSIASQIKDIVLFNKFSKQKGSVGKGLNFADDIVRSSIIVKREPYSKMGRTHCL